MRLNKKVFLRRFCISREEMDRFIYTSTCRGRMQSSVALDSHLKFEIVVGDMYPLILIYSEIGAIVRN